MVVFSIHYELKGGKGLKTAQGIIEKDINNFVFLFTRHGSDAGLHVVVGKIGLAAELELITLDEMNDYIDRLFLEHAKTKK